MQGNSAIVAEGLWQLANDFEAEQQIPQAVMCLEAICQSNTPFLPEIEVKTRLRIATLLFEHTVNATQAKAHLERAQVLLKQIPSSLDLKCKAQSLLSRCYYLIGNVKLQKQAIKRGLELLEGASPSSGNVSYVWSANFLLQLASAHITEGDWATAVKWLEEGRRFSAKAGRLDLEMLFVSALLHVGLMKWDRQQFLADAKEACQVIWNRIPQEQKRAYKGLELYFELLVVIYLTRVCRYNEALQHVNKLDGMLQREELESGGPGGLLASEPLGLDWLRPPGMVVMIDLMAALCLRPGKGLKEALKRVKAGISIVRRELEKLGVGTNVTEGELQHWVIWVAGTYLVLLLNLLDNKALIELTRTHLCDAQTAIVEVMDLMRRYPTILDVCSSQVHVLVGQYAHSLGCFQEAVVHFAEAREATENRELQSLCSIYGALSQMCIDMDPDCNSKALDLINPIMRNMDSFTGSQEKSSCILVSGILSWKQQNMTEAKNKLTSGLQLTHGLLGNHQVTSQYLTLLGNIALHFRDPPQALNILKSALTIAQTQHDLPIQLGIISELEMLYKDVGDTAKGGENAAFQRQKMADFVHKVNAAKSTPYHQQILQYRGKDA
ncbi:hypothetical protein CBR_g46787 [Chara braunii]|uniref:MAU2 chromatid cohesion factor homolog n=1 Tax=Chara braunii TaxID=69332 RepID=A0A388M0W9_CHABU|nr:hypothetical protein CBR_g46787 [Chara braunii]|eukprot:GBG88220.1 hypothetical protein CBR_g46787 [Chara braunii]